MQSFVKIGGPVLEKSVDETMTLCNFNKDLSVSNMIEILESKDLNCECAKCLVTKLHMYMTYVVCYDL